MRSAVLTGQREDAQNSQNYDKQKESKKVKWGGWISPSQQMVSIARVARGFIAVVRCRPCTQIWNVIFLAKLPLFSGNPEKLAIITGVIFRDPILTPPGRYLSGALYVYISMT